MAFDPDAYLNSTPSSGGFDPDAYLGIKPNQRLDTEGQPVTPDFEGPGYTNQAPQTAGQVFDAYGRLIPIAMGMAGGPVGAATAAGGEALRQMLGTLVGGKDVPKTPLGVGASVIGAGVAQEPKMLTAIPGASQVGKMASDLVGNVGNVGKGLAKAGQTLSGAKADVLEQAAKQGYSTYAAPSLEKAQTIFGKALGPEGQAAMKQTAAEAFDPAVTKARDIATQIGTKIEQGQPVSAIEALKARQATDRVISATPITDKVTRSSLFDWRTAFDNKLSSQSGELADASRTYRKAIVKDQLLSPTRLNKSGEPSAFLPMLVGHGMMGKGIEGGLGLLTGTSPLVWGAGATTAGQLAKGLNVIGQNPAIRQALMGVLQKIQQGSNAGAQR